MPALSKYEDAAAAFIVAHPAGTPVGPDRLVNWAAGHANGLQTDLLIGDPDKRVSALRRHLNNGGASRNLTEDQRFYIVVEDAKRKMMRVQSLADRAKEQADQAFGKSVIGAITPIKRSQKAIDDIKLEELTNDKRHELEDMLKELVETAAPLRTLLSAQVINHWSKKLEAKGYTRQQARDMIEHAPFLLQASKLLKATA